MIVPYTASGSVDLLARLMAPKLSESLGQQVIVDNRPGAAGNIGTEAVVRAPPDGYTIVMTTVPLVLNPSLYEKLPFDAVRDLAPVSLLAAAAYVLIVHPSVPVRSVKELIALAKKQPDKVLYASGGKGTNSHIAFELFRYLTGTRMLHVPYKGGGPEVIGLLSGESETALLAVDVASPHIRAGRFRALATSTRKRLSALPELADDCGSRCPRLRLHDVVRPARTRRDAREHHQGAQRSCRHHDARRGSHRAPCPAEHRRDRELARRASIAYQDRACALAQSRESDGPGRRLMRVPGLLNVAAALLLCAPAAFAQDPSTGRVLSTVEGSGQAFPVKPIRILTSEPGGGNDFGARLIAQGISGSLGQPIIVENRGGGSGSITGELLAKAKPDGYTLLMYGQGIWLLPFLRRNVPYDPLKDFAPVSLTDRSPNVLVVHPSLPVKSVRELIALAKARPGDLSYARAAVGGPPHLSAELFKSMTRVSILAVPYRGGGPAVIGLLSGEVGLMFATSASIATHVKAGTVKALAVTTAQPSPLFPGLPALAATVPGFESVATTGIFAPKGTPPAIVRRLSDEVARFLAKPETREKFLSAGVETVGSTPEEHATILRREIAKWSRVIKEAGIREE